MPQDGFNDRMRNGEADALASMSPIIEAVCFELGVKERERARRQAVEDRVLGAFRRGRTLPLNLVAAGLAETDLRGDNRT